MASKDIDPTLDVAVVAETQIAAAADLSVFDARGNTIRFGALFELEKTIVVFIRHFFCGRCQDYVSQLTTVRSEALEQAGTKIIIIGCGDWILINNYRELTCATPHPLISYYADPTRNLYRALGITAENLATTPKGGHKRSYVAMGKLVNAARSVVRALKNWPSQLGKQGNLSQLGGELILGPSNSCHFAHFMRHTEDHIDVPELLQKADVAYP